MIIWRSFTVKNDTEVYGSCKVKCDQWTIATCWNPDGKFDVGEKKRRELQNRPPKVALDGSTHNLSTEIGGKAGRAGTDAGREGGLEEGAEDLSQLLTSSSKLRKVIDSGGKERGAIEGWVQVVSRKVSVKWLDGETQVGLQGVFEGDMNLKWDQSRVIEMFIAQYGDESVSHYT